MNPIEPCTIRIAGTGSYLPERVVDNEEVARHLGVDDDYIVRVSGIRRRHWASPDEPCSVLAEHAARRAIDNAGMRPEDVDAVLVSTTSPETGGFPSTACLVQRRLGIRGPMAFDLSASCSGFLYGLSLADALIRSGAARCCLVVAAEVKSQYVDVQDAATSFLFGDGAGAAIIAPSGTPNRGFQDLRIAADGQHADLVHIPAGGSRRPMSRETIRARLHTIQLRGAPLFRVAVKQLGRMVHELLQANMLTVDDVDHAIFHQANRRILLSLAHRLRLDPLRLVSVIEHTGNTSSASLPMAMDCANRDGRLKPGELVLLGTFGGGVTYGGALLRWG